MTSLTLEEFQRRFGHHDGFDDDESDWEPIGSDDATSCLSSQDSDSFDDDDSSVSDAVLPIDPESTTAVCLQDNNNNKEDTYLLLPKDTSLTSPLNAKTTRRRLLSPILLLLPLLALVGFSLFHFAPATKFEGSGDESIYIPGVGFSGFWFTLGRLKSIPQPATKDYVCFSAGCLASVAILNNFSVDEMACMAITAQNAWKRGEINRYQVVDRFVDGLVYRQFPNNPSCIGGDKKNAKQVPINNPQLFSKLHILTTEVTSESGVQSTMRSPNSLNELKEMLIQTTWIPIATGSGLTHNGHMDGGFTMLQHPQCDKYVSLPLHDAGLLLNSLNVNMGKDEAYRLWNDGLAYGL